MSYGNSTSSWKPWKWVRLELIFTMRNISSKLHISSNLDSLPKFASNNKSNKFKYILPWSISKIITKMIPVSRRMVISYMMKGTSPFELDEKSMETATATWSEFPSGGKTIVEQILVTKEIINLKEQGCESHGQGFE